MKFESMVRPTGYLILLNDDFNRTENGHTDKKVGDQLIEKMDEFEKGFRDGVYADSNKEKMPRINMCALSRHCSERGIKPKDLTDKEMKHFILHKE